MQSAGKKTIIELMKRVDLHTHSTKSDGTYTPSKLMAYAVEKGLKAIALTDHDTTEGITEARDWIASNNADLELVPGIEFSTIHTAGKEHDIHVVGLFIDYASDAFQAKLNSFIDSRVTRNHRMCAKLTAFGMPVTYDDLRNEFPGGVITRAHYGRYLLNHGYVRTIKEAFDRYIGEGCPCYVPREKVSPTDAVRIILAAKGVPVLAHPILYNMKDIELRGLVQQMKEAGLVGIEAIYSTYDPEDEQYIRRIAKDYDLQISGGSDFHGTNKPGIDLGTGLGSLFVPEDVLERLRFFKPVSRQNPL